MPTRRQLANAIRALSMDAVQKANSGHPGMPMGMADIAQVLWADHLQAQPGQPRLGRPRPLRAVERPRLDAALLAAAPDRLPARRSTTSQNFRQFGSQTAGHPEVDAAPRHRDHHRPARPGPRQCRRHGAGREAARRRVQPPRPRDRRPPHLRVPRRRLPDGRHLARGLLAGRHAEARQADRASTTTTASPSTARCTAGSPTTRRSASRPTAGTSCRTSTATTPTRSTRAIEAAQADRRGRR